ncbi:nuclear transport factor 2 family protein [Salinirubellus salinus]|uniref:Nuclear transport factor 2 family protein n=1 Tax=Salinirubellus salinus TaxID=1364945 RepID=A0A9E7R5H0_9EURY|nr:nuclear transport factor 2 family protein [Salinirubellus salinus]UWM55569.1 nuclear transport factor 2 family protein [Salinirubellus salinus]
MATRIHGWERESTDPVLVRRFVRSLFEGDADGATALVSERCVFHGSWVDEGDDGEAAVDTALELVGSADVELETVETTDTEGLISATVTTSGHGGPPVSPDPEATALTDADAEVPPFATCRVEDDRIVEVWLDVAQLGDGTSGPLGALLGRVSAWLHAD